MKYTFERHRSDKFSKEKLLLELERVAGLYNYVEFGKRDFDRLANMSHNPVVNQFGSWSAGIDALKQHLRQKGLVLTNRPRVIISDQALFNEMDRIWSALQHRPSRLEWQSMNPKYSRQPYKTRFDGWQNACLKFIEYKMGHELSVQIEPVVPILSPKSAKHKKLLNREVPLKLRLEVLARDAFRCVLCGRSPATHRGIALHIDHIIPFSKGGKSTRDNLQTLCSDCNLGKGNQSHIGQNGG